jgi:cytochrome c oxidase assembly protein subunit 15
MVVVGGVTRLTGSGLSMVTWEPVSGVAPPLSETAWQEEFQRYQQSPEYHQVNRGMSLGDFKRIYWVEFAHRLLGRATGLVFLIPFLYFAVRRKLPSTLALKLLVALTLGGLQGLLGWYMVKSGLIDQPRVSPYRLTAHLGLAVLIYGLLLWLALDLLSRRDSSDSVQPGLRRAGQLVMALVCVALLSGGFVAGLKAGYAFDTFPKMAGQWVPEGMFALQPPYRNFFENVVTVQFNHRVLAMIVLASVASLWFCARRMHLPFAARVGCHLALLAAAVQVTLGISTLLLHVPTAIATAHQAGALILFTAILFFVHQLRR